MYDTKNLLSAAEAAEGWEAWPEGPVEVLGRGGWLAEFASLEAALAYCREELVSGRAEPHEHAVRPARPHPDHPRVSWGTPSAYNMLTPPEED